MVCGWALLLAALASGSLVALREIGGRIGASGSRPDEPLTYVHQEVSLIDANTIRLGDDLLIGGGVAMLASAQG